MYQVVNEVILEEASLSHILEMEITADCQQMWDQPLFMYQMSQNNIYSWKLHLKEYI